MRGSAPRRVLKSVVGPALGTTLAALLAVTGCNQTPDAVTPDDSTKRSPAPTPTASSPSPQPSPSPVVVVDAGGAPDIPEPGKSPPPVGKPPPPVGTTAMPKVGKIPKPGKTAPDVDDHSDARPTRPTRRATDPTYQPMIGSGPRRLA